MEIETPKEFSFAECLTFLGRSREERLHSITKNSVFKPLKIDDANYLLRVTNALSQRLQVEVVSGRPPQSAKSKISAYIREWFDLETDLAPFYQLAKRDRMLQKLTSVHYGLRLIRIPDLFQALCWAIIGQQINLAFAYTLYRRLIETCGEQFSANDAQTWFFPTPGRIAELTPEDLMQLQFTRKKSEYIIGVARQLCDGTFSKQKLQQLDLASAEKVLVQIRGVGTWTANYVLMRCLGFRSAFPIEDIGLHRAIQRQLGLSVKPTLDQIRRLSKGWRDWEAYATFYLYRSLL